ncbi:MAG: hypothetical protein GYB33_20825 [Gammaproteobacteria bacterium]|nr:hypothetical protein [Gammaproteobacteria bacterium]
MNIRQAVVIILPWLFYLAAAHGVEHKLGGLLDLRFSVSDTLPSYLGGDYGKFQYSDGATLAPAQAALSYRGELTDAVSVHLVGHGYFGGVRDGAGLSEAYVQYRGLPSAQGWRWQARAGLLYPQVSMVNIQTAWTSPYTLDFDTINSWIGEEVRHQGIDIALTRLGNAHNSGHDFSAGVAVYRDNDPVGAMLSWHGWVLSSRQSLRNETLPLPQLEPGFVPAASDPFLELDNRLGYHLRGQWHWHNHGKLLLGYYDNQADPKVVERGQWAWTTRFAHLGVHWQLPGNTDLVAQYLVGDTLMQSSRSGADLVNNGYHSGFVMVSKKVARHRLSARLEEFAVVDRDSIAADNNNEYGKAATLNYSYRLNRHWFLHSEYSWIESLRPARAAAGNSLNLTEQQWQLGVRFLF